MINKKNPNVNIERRKTSFFLVGLVVALGCSFTVINLEWQKHSLAISDTYEPIGDTEIEIMPDVTKVTPKVRPKLAVITDIIKIVEIIPEDVVEKPIKTEDIPDLTLPEGEPNIVDIEEIEEIIDETPLDFFKVEKFPTFENCGDVSTKEEQKKCFESGLLNHIKSNFKYPQIEKEMGIQGRVYVNFVIGRNGKVKNLEIANADHDGFIKEAKRLIKSLPKVKPAEQRGTAVNMKYTIPIYFKLK